MSKTPPSVHGPTAVNFCPFCGAKAIKFRGLVPRCMWCRAVFFVQFSRHLRAPKKR